MDKATANTSIKNLNTEANTLSPSSLISLYEIDVTDLAIKELLIKNSKFIKIKKARKVRKIIICSGKIYFDLIEAREKNKVDDVIFVRIEELYPFPVKSLTKVIKPYISNSQFFWCQEEPKNMGAWSSVRDYIQWTLDNLGVKKQLDYIGRKAAASPATGYANRHTKQQKEILDKVLK